MPNASPAGRQGPFRSRGHAMVAQACLARPDAYTIRGRGGIWYLYPRVIQTYQNKSKTHQRMFQTKR